MTLDHERHHHVTPAAVTPATIDGPFVCTVLPTYNEAGNIAVLIEGILQSAVTRHCVLVVDDNSPDGTGCVVRRVAERYNRVPDCPRVVLVQRMDASGLTSAIQHGIDIAIYTLGADIVTWMDCDLSMPPQDVPRLVRTVVDHDVDIAIGSRWIPGGADIAHGPMARTLSWIINAFAMLLLGNRVHDYTSGFIAARAPLLQRLRLRGDYGEYCIDLLGRAAQDYRICEVPYICVPRTAGESKTGANLWDYLVKGRKYVATVWRLFYRYRLARAIRRARRVR